MANIPDHAQREQALALGTSFIIQAPAGSGKTELLTQRILALLATVKAPEEIIAITFTRKAAHEMRERVLASFAKALQPAPTSPHALRTWQLAHAALAQDKKQHWELIQNPNRLRIMTIDAFCASLTRQLPLLCGFGASPQIIDDAQALYLQTARDLLTDIDSDYPWAESLQRLLLHLDNWHQRAETLLASMLANRDQWLPYLGYNQDQPAVKAILEAGLQALITDHLHALAQLLPNGTLSELDLLAEFANQQLLAQASEPILTRKPSTLQFHWQDLASWRQLATWLLTKDGQWRKAFNKNQGFPSVSASCDKQSKQQWQQMKIQMQQLVEDLAQHELLHANLADLLFLPDPYYNDNQWRIIAALLEILPTLAAQLLVNFASFNAVDHIEVTLRALQALGQDEAPTNLALSLDYQIKHLLVDEFQDTSSSQFRLLEKLIATWQPDDGRTLFLVGDPMQSIYRFRKAEVGLFLRAREQGIGQLPLQALTLSANFRSQATLVQWFNHAFSNIFPSHNKIDDGAICYSPALAILAATTQAGVSIHPHVATSDEAATIVNIIQTTLANSPQAQIAILVRARSHVATLLPALQAANIAYHATEIASLRDKPVVQDCLALSKALCHFADSTAWLSVLRAPWCGLSLADLHLLAYQEQSQSLWQRLTKFQQLGLSADGQLRCQRLLDVISQSLRQRHRFSLRTWVQRTWFALGGPACVKYSDDLDAAERFFALLNELDDHGELCDWEALERRLDSLLANSQQQQSSQVEIMTIHKAKGLEFDCVILPNLGQATRGQDSQLLLWLEYTSADKIHLLLGSIKHSQEHHDSIYNYLRLLEDRRNALENARLLYVAATRAKQQLHLVGSAVVKQKKDHATEFSVAANSFLAKLWPTLHTAFEQQLLHSTSTTTAACSLTPTVMPTRLPLTWSLPTELQHHHLQLENPHHNPRTYDITPENKHLAHVGTVVHRLLQRIGTQGIANWTTATLSQQTVWIKLQLYTLGVLSAEIDTCCHLVLQAVSNTLADSIGQWILAAHTDAATELAMHAVINNEVKHYIVDRTFIDSQGVRWIIDYKTGSQVTANATLATLIAKHTPQLESYAYAFTLFENRPIHLGLYFPLLPAWHQWEYSSIINTDT